MEGNSSQVKELQFLLDTSSEDDTEEIKEILTASNIQIHKKQSQKSPEKKIQKLDGTLNREKSFRTRRSKKLLENEQLFLASQNSAVRKQIHINQELKKVVILHFILSSTNDIVSKLVT